MSDPIILGNFEAVHELTENDNFHTSIYESDYDGLLIARCNQNGRHPHQITAILNGLNAKQASAELVAQYASRISQQDAELERLRREVEELRDAKWQVQHVDTMNDIASLRIALEGAEAALAEARKAAFIEAATLIDEGFDRGIKSKRDTCAHGKFEWEDCEQCASAAIRAKAEETRA